MSLCFLKKFPPKFWDIEYDGILSPQVTCRLVTELLKFVVFEKQQIPAPFEQLVAQQKKQDQSEENSQKKRAASLNDKRKQKFIENFEYVIKNLESAFKCCSKIEQILILLGGTVVNPKEAYLIKLPIPGTYEGKILSVKPCVRNFFRKIITSDLFIDLKSISITNTFVMIQAPRDSKIEWFVPKPTYNFRQPSRGRVITLSISSNCIVHESELTKANASAFEISGVEPLNGTLDASLYDNLSNLCINDGSTADELSCENMTAELLGAHAIDDDDDDAELIWYQAPITIKGFKDKLPPLKLKPSDIWG